MVQQLVLRIDPSEDQDRPDEAIESYNTTRSQTEAADAKALAIARQAFAAGCRELFTAHPPLASLGWTQCSDDEGNFFLSSDQPDINGVDGFDVEEDGDSSAIELQQAVAELLGLFNDDHLRTLFNAAPITIHRDGRVVMGKEQTTLELFRPGRERSWDGLLRSYQHALR
jgi:hypothetical protein